MLPIMDFWPTLYSILEYMWRKLEVGFRIVVTTLLPVKERTVNKDRFCCDFLNCFFETRGEFENPEIVSKQYSVSHLCQPLNIHHYILSILSALENERFDLF